MEWHTISRISHHMHETAEGYLVCRDVPIARTGTQIYWEHEVPPLQGDAGGRVHVGRDPAEVFAPDSVRSYEGKPLVDDHPFEAVGPDNWSDLTIGYIANVRRGEGIQDELLLGDLIFTTRKGIDRVRRGKRALSVGYNAKYEQTEPGFGRQREIFCNHVALVDEGRCGARCTIMDGRAVYDYDAADDFIESEHPRDDEGKFAEGGGEAGGSGEEPSSGPAHPIHTLEGAQAFIDKLSDKYPIAKQGGRVEVRPDDIRGSDALGTHRGGHVYLSPEMWNEEFLTKHAKEWEGMVHDSSPEGILTHEFGHMLSHKLEQKIDPITLWNIVYKHLGHTGGNLSIDGDQTSPYGQENIFEFIAEAFTGFDNGKYSVTPDHPFHDKMKAAAEGVWKELLDTAAGPALPKTPEAARFIATMHNMETAYSTERLQAAADLLKDSTKRGDGKIKARLAKELKARAKEGSSNLHPEVRQLQTDVMNELGGMFPGVQPKVVYEARNNPTFDPWESAIKLPSYGKDRPLAEVDREEDAANSGDYVVKAGLRGTLMHEFGHAIDHHIIKNASEDLKDEWFKKKRAMAQEMGAASPYGASRSQEWLPERLTAELLGKAPKTLIPVLQSYLAKLSKGTADDDDWTRDVDWVESEHPRDPVGKFSTAPGGSAGVTAEAHLEHAAQSHRKALATERALEGKPADTQQFAARRAVVHTAAHLTAAREAHAQIESGGSSSAASLAASSSLEPAPKLPPLGKTKEARQRYAEIKELADRVQRATATLPAALKHIPMHQLQSALNDLWDTRMPDSGKLSKVDQGLNDTLRAEVTRRFQADRDEREQRAHEYAYMTDDEISQATGLAFGGDSRMKPGLKAQLGRLPAAHVRYLKHNKMTVRGLQELERMPPDHPYAPNMQPAGLFEPAQGRISVADQITLPDGTKRQLWSRGATLRHEVGHAIDDITGLSHEPDLLNAVADGISRMTPEERKAAAYYLGDGASNEPDRINARRKETFAEMYAYAFNEGADPDTEHGSLGGMSSSRRYQLFGKARQILRQKLAEWVGDRTLDRVREAA